MTAMASICLLLSFIIDRLQRVVPSAQRLPVAVNVPESFPVAIVAVDVIDARVGGVRHAFG